MMNWDETAPVEVTIGGRVLPHEPRVNTKLKACAALLLEEEAFSLAEAAEKLGWEVNELYKVAVPYWTVGWWGVSSPEDRGMFLLFVAEAVAGQAQQGQGQG